VNRHRAPGTGRFVRIAYQLCGFQVPVVLLSFISASRSLRAVLVCGCWEVLACIAG
jgi:hypothetical protein